MHHGIRVALSSFLTFGALTACGEGAIGDLGGDPGDLGETEVTSLDEESSSAPVVSLSNGSSARTTANLNLRSGPSTSNRIITTMPSGSTVTVRARSDIWYSVTYQGTTGWASGNYLAASSSGGGSTNPPATNPPPSSGNAQIDTAMARAVSGVGFSYYWGGGAWDPNSTSYGACYGGCPDCTHSGTWGADCSGYITKIWQVPGPVAVTTRGHGPYNTTSYYENRTHWSQVSRSNAKRGDAFVRRGHIFLYNSGDAWGSINAYEAKGCSYGIVRNNRSADSSYIVIRKNGF
jgi:hypothetical protein